MLLVMKVLSKALGICSAMCCKDFIWKTLEAKEKERKECDGAVESKLCLGETLGTLVPVDKTIPKCDANF